MRQRNDTGHVVDVAAYPTDAHPGDRPFTVGPGEVVQFHDLLGGFTALDDEPESTVDPAPAKTTRKRAEQAPVPEGDEQP